MIQYLYFSENILNRNGSVTTHVHSNRRGKEIAIAKLGLIIAVVFILCHSIKWIPNIHEILMVRIGHKFEIGQGLRVAFDNITILSQILSSTYKEGCLVRTATERKRILLLLPSLVLHAMALTTYCQRIVVCLLLLNQQTMLGWLQSLNIGLIGCTK